MTFEQFQQTLSGEEPNPHWPAPLRSLWWEARGDWSRAHDMVDSLESMQGMAVHAYLHRKEGNEWNANYWYHRSGRQFHRPDLTAEWEALVRGLLHEFAE